MGLDMYVYSVDKSDIVESETKKHTLVPKKGASPTEIHYWRKHHDLHGLMEEIYRSKGGEEKSFNCISLPLDEADLDIIQARIENSTLPKTTGFFFGNSPPDDESKKEDLAVIARLREELKQGKIVFYDSWW